MRLIGSEKNKGFSVILVSIVILLVILTIGLRLIFLSVGEQKILRSAIKSDQAYYLAESGVEDAILLLKKNPKITGLSYSFNSDNGNVSVNISNITGGSRIITSQGSFLNRIKKLQVIYKIDSQTISFYYGVQAREGGIEMGNNSRIKGNIYSNGSVIAQSGTGYIDNNIIVVGNGSKIKNLSVAENATVNACENSAISKTLTYVSGGTLENCTAGQSTEIKPEKIVSQDLPITLGQITDLKNKAAAGGIIGSNVYYSSTTYSLGPIQIGTPESPKNLTVTNDAVLKVTGTIYITGDIIFDNNSLIELDKDSYGSFGGMIISDGKIIVGNNVILRGSGEKESYLLVLSTNSSVDPSSPAIQISSNVPDAIFYAPSGLIYLDKDVKAKEITGYKLRINDNVQVQCENDLKNIMFSSGPGDSWVIEGWKEIE
jgi:Tfp pilus assembly protein PilX